MFVHNHDSIIAVYNHSFLPIQTINDNRLLSSFLYVDACYEFGEKTLIVGSFTKQYSDLTITVELRLLHINKMQLQMRININNYGYVYFKDFFYFCEQENIHDFDILFSTVYVGKLLHNFTLEERQYFIDHFKFREQDFDIVDNIYIENNIKYKLYTATILLFNEFAETSSSFYGDLIKPKMDNISPKLSDYAQYRRIYGLLKETQLINESQYVSNIKDNFMIACKNGENTYYIYCDVDDYIYIKCENVYTKSNKKTFEHFYEKNIVNQFNKQLELYKKLAR